MPRYQFDLVDHHTVEDHGGQLLADDTIAEDVADELAGRIYESGRNCMAKDTPFS
jgi:hypothetical protein